MDGLTLSATAGMRDEVTDRARDKIDSPLQRQSLERRTEHLRTRMVSNRTLIKPKREQADREARPHSLQALA